MIANAHHILKNKTRSYLEYNNGNNQELYSF